MYVVPGIALRRVKGVCPHKFQKINDFVYLFLLVCRTYRLVHKN